MRRNNIGFLFLSTSIVRFSSIIAQSVIPLYINSFIASSKLISIAIALLWISNGVGSLFSIYFKKIHNFLIISFSLTSLGFLFLVFNNNYFQIYISIILIGVGLGSISILLAPSMHQANNKFEGIGLYSFALSMGLILGTLFSSIILTYLSFKFIFISTILLLVSPLIFTLKNKYNPIDINIKFKINNLFSIIQNKKFLKYLTFNFIYSLILPLIISYWGIYETKTIGLKPNLVMISLFLLFILSSLIRFALIKINEKGLIKMEILAIAILPLIFIFLNTNNLILNITGLLLFSIPHSVLYPSFLYKAFNSLDKNNVVIGNMIFSTSSGAGEFLSPLIALTIITYFNISKLFLFTLPIPILLLIFYLLAYNSKV
ncbi:Major Facilitator Superfamily transporter [Caldisphaera lagunensis DSM 15908]|uniref:Major Facilitator Superfamily transporter n=1 Tax=Caldisphaera lagunensis (strain DSM 15908 / JCM 11604 / ANMR 0165 / IC-154) TaxID=1056495 RepID=L0A8A1_CALLD|nr:MFS transporter [Caldisphaera lagunensis]AFZ70066.1 Major Facilitator Superfamily transporter [Caldisphaera lagunensis DSM 15908]